jgi:hypothetical protein
LTALRQNAAVRSLRLIGVLAAVVTVAAGCGSGGGSAGGSGGASGASESGLSTSVSNAKVSVTGNKVTGTARVSVGGAAGKKVTFEWGLVDAVAGRESQAEKVIARYVSTKSTQQHDETITFAKPSADTPYLIHFVLYGPDGSYLGSADTDEFNDQP